MTEHERDLEKVVQLGIKEDIARAELGVLNQVVKQKEFEVKKVTTDYLKAIDEYKSKYGQQPDKHYHRVRREVGSHFTELSRCN